MEILKQIGGLSYLGVFGISLLANIILPFPEEVTLLTLGYLSGVGVFHWAIIIPIAMAGLFISDWALYVLSYKGSKITQRVYNKLFAKRFDFLNNLSGERLERVIVITRFLPYFRFLAPFLTGHFKLPFKEFVRHELISLSVYVPLFVFLGFFLRNRIERIMLGVGIIQNVTIAVVLLIIGYFFFRGLKRYFMRYLDLNFLNKD